MVFVIFYFIFIAAYYYSTRKYGYWSKRGVKHDPPLPFFGNNIQQLLRLRTTTELYTELYHKYPNEKAVGFYKQTTPVLIVRDLDIAKRVLAQDFLNFCDRGLITNDLEIIYQDLLHAKGDNWKVLRKSMIEAFSITKVKSMFPILLECTEKLQVVAERIAVNKEVFDARALMEQFSIEFIGSAGFGVELDTINNEHSQFRHIIRVDSPPLKTQLLQIVCDICPPLRSLIHVHDSRLEKCVNNLVCRVLERRRRGEKPSGREDFVDVLLKILSQSEINGDSLDNTNPNGTQAMAKKELDFPRFVAQVSILFATGIVKSAAAMSYTLHEIAYNPDVQRRIQKNIDEVLQKHNGELSFESVFDMTVLKMALYEGMRMREPTGVIARVCTKKCTIPELDIRIDEGVKVIIPTQGIYHDDKYFKDPKKFIPERFTPDEIQKRHKLSFMPFGKGPRMCIGSLLGEMLTLTVLAIILSKYNVVPSEKSQRWPKIDHTRNIVQDFTGGLPLKLIPRDSP